MKNLTNKRILLGLSGGIAAYKSAELLRRLRDRGATVQVVMTHSACEFITPLTMQALSGRPVHTQLLDHDSEAGMGHIELARWSDVIVVAPASANFIARLSHGMADDLLSTLCLAADVPLAVAPAMNQQMWRNRATQDNIRTLEERDVLILGPGTGEQACGETGPGRMLEPLQLLNSVEAMFQNTMLAGKNIIVTAGPTREAIDPVRYISNKSSGKMGYAIARAASEAGANVTLVSGPVSLSAPDGLHYIGVDTAEQMRNAVLDSAGTADIVIAAAAVADYRCESVSEQKIKKKDERLSLSLTKNPDVLAEVAKMKPSLFTVGFAAETESLRENALSKLDKKGLDMIAANLVGENLAFDSDENALEVLWPDGGVSLQLAPKDKLARQLVETIARNYYEKCSDKAH